jgi:hypothetical protein
MIEPWRNKVIVAARGADIDSQREGYSKMVA